MPQATLGRPQPLAPFVIIITLYLASKPSPAVSGGSSMSAIYSRRQKGCSAVLRQALGRGDCVEGEVPVQSPVPSQRSARGETGVTTTRRLQLRGLQRTIGVWAQSSSDRSPWSPPRPGWDASIGVDFAPESSERQAHDAVAIDTLEWVLMPAVVVKGQGPQGCPSQPHHGPHRALADGEQRDDMLGCASPVFGCFG